MSQAIWNGQVIAQSEKTIVVEGNHYFPPASLKTEYFEPSPTKSICGWKGEASYYTLNVDGQRNEDAAWYYAAPKAQAANIQGHVAFWKGVTVEDTAGQAVDELESSGTCEPPGTSSEEPPAS